MTTRKKEISLKSIFTPILLALFFILVIFAGSTFYPTYLGFKKPNAAKVWFPSPIDLWTRGINPAIEQIYFGLLNVIFVKDVPETSSIPTVKLLLPENTLDRFNHEILLYGLNILKKKPYSKALAKTEGETSFLPAKTRMRGVHNDHHQIWKPSLRISYKKNAFPEGYKNHVIIAPRDGIGFQNWITDQLAQKWGLLTPKEHFVRMFVNKKYFGLYTRVWRLDESLLINTGRLPSPFFRMEYLIDRKYRRFYGHWNDPQTWDYKSIEKTEGMKLIRRVVDNSSLLNLPKTKFFTPEETRAKLKFYSEQLNSYIDQNSFAKFLSILCYAGETHVDDIHNNAFWLDPGSGKLKPILIDTGGMSFKLNRHLERPITKRRGAFIQSWLLNPINFSIYVDHLYELLNTIGSPTNEETLIINTWNKIRPHAFSDVLSSKSGCFSRCFVGINRLEKIIDELIRFINLRTQWIKKQLSSDKLVLLKQHENKFEIYIEGFSGFKIKRKDGKNFILKGSQKKRPHFSLLPSMSFEFPNQLKVKTPEAYAFYTLPGHSDEYVFTHRLTGDYISFQSLQRDFKTLHLVRGLNALDFSHPTTKPIELGPGTILFEETKIFNINQVITIKPGTNILLGPNVSLITQGPLIVNGDSKHQITIRPKTPNEPFGVVAILGEGTKGSKINFLDIEGGSVAKFNTLDLTGMFSVHDCPKITITNSRFGQNFIGDDAAHFIRSKVEINNSTFEDALNDAIDWDLVDGKISGSFFRNSGNDGLDISMGTAHIKNSRFEKGGDKCISVGEGAQATVRDSKFLHCNIGIAVKDRSKIELVNNLFSENNIAYNTYRKKWRWEKGGEAVIRNTLFLNSVQTDIKGDKLSKVFFETIPKNLRVEGKLKLSSNTDKNKR
jgi:hypothetical protein